MKFKREGTIEFFNSIGIFGIQRSCSAQRERTLVELVLSKGEVATARGIYRRGAQLDLSLKQTSNISVGYTQRRGLLRHFFVSQISTSCDS